MDSSSLCPSESAASLDAISHLKTVHHKGVTYCNITPHEIKVYEECDDVSGSSPETPHLRLVLTIPPSGCVARVEQRDEDVEPIGGIRTITSVRKNEVQDMPPPVPGVYYIASGLTQIVMREAYGRTDVISPASGPGAVVRVRGFMVGTTAWSIEPASVASL